MTATHHKAASDGGPPADIDVRLIQVRPLRLVEWVPAGEASGEIGLDGELEVVVENRSQRPVKLRDLEVHGLVFSDRRGCEHLVIHSCQCVRDLSEGPPTIALAPGGSHRFSLDEWGCSAMWKPPGAGSYVLSYRLVQAKAETQQDAARQRRRPPRELIAQCRRELQSPEFWQGAVTSPAIPLELEPPVRQEIPT